MTSFKTIRIHDKYNSNTSHSDKTFNQNKQPFRQNLCYACMHTKICAHSKTINTDMNVQHAREHIQGHSVNHELIPTIIPKQSPAPCCTLQVQRNQQDQANNKNGLQGQDFEKPIPINLDVLQRVLFGNQNFNYLIDGFLPGFTPGVEKLPIAKAVSQPYFCSRRPNNSQFEDTV